MDGTSDYCPAIFLSHSGAQKLFTQHIDHELRRTNHSCFFDRDAMDSLRKGDMLSDRILQCINGCKLGVVVLSEDFITSLWPMAELENLIAANKPIFPIFYGLKPRDMEKETNLQRWREIWDTIQLSTEKKSLITSDISNCNDWLATFLLFCCSKFGHVQQEKSIPSDLPFDIRKWRTCLAKVQSIAGSEFDPSLKQMYEFIDKTVVPQICKLCPPHALFFVDDSTIKGGNRIAQEIAKTFEMLSETAQENVKQRSIVVGIHGIGGSGKSTLCKTMVDHYNKHQYSGASYFMELPPDESQSTLVSLLKGVLKHLTQAREELLEKINDFDQAVSVLQQRVQGKSFFLAIDNVWDWSEDHVERILNILFYQKEIKLMITSRKVNLLKSVFRTCGVGENNQKILHVPSINQQEAWAFIISNIDQGKLKAINEKKLKAIQERCILDGGYHPLLLEIIAKKLVHLDISNESVLDECLQLLQGSLRSTTHKEKKILRIFTSIYDNLSEDLKNLFINTAIVSQQVNSYRGQQRLLRCTRFINGFIYDSDLEKKMKLLEQHGLLKLNYKEIGSPYSKFEVYDYEYVELQIHDLVMELAKKEAIKRGEYLIDGAGQLFISATLEPSSLTQVTRVFIDENSKDEDLKEKRDYKSNVMQCCVNKLEVLVILEPERMMTFLENNFVNLHMLWLSCREISMVHLEASPNLKFLYLEHCDYLEEITNINCLDKLQVLSISCLDKPQEMCMGAKDLVVPDLSHCTSLRRLEFSSWKLTKFAALKCPTTLEVLNLDLCPNLVSIKGLECLISLRTISFQHCQNLQLLMPGVDNWYDNFRLMEFLCIVDIGQPVSMNLFGLRVLKLYKVVIKKGGVHLLAVQVDEEGAKALDKAFGTTSLQQLKYLRIHVNHVKEEVVNFKNLSRLENLNGLGLDINPDRCKFSTQVSENILNSLIGVTNLKRLELTQFADLESLPDLSHLACLSKLKVLYFFSLKSVDSVNSLTSLIDLKIKWCSSLKEIKCFASLVNLRRLSLWHCNSLEIIDSISSLTNLEELKIRCVKSLNSPNLSNLMKLTYLYIDNVNWDTLPTLSSLQSLVTLSIRDTPNLKKVPNLHDLVNLSRLSLICCQSLIVRVDQLICLTNLGSLKIKKCLHLIGKLEHLKSSLPRLEEVDCDVTPKIDFFMKLKL